MASTWLVVSEIDGSVVLSLAETREDAEAKSEALLAPRGGSRTMKIEPKAAGSGVVELDHDVRAARVLVFRRAGQPFVPRRSTDEEEELPPGIPAAYDLLCPFGYDIDRELTAGRQPPADRVTPFVQRLGIPIVLSRKVEAAASLSSVARNDRLRKMTIGIVVVVLILIAAAVVFIFRSLR